ncbi:MAG: lysylphosphatidylglycerol synthase domain-containing protein [Bacteroidota bacterium]
MIKQQGWKTLNIRPSMKNWFRYIFYASLIFLVIALIRADYLVIPHVYNYTKLTVSFLLLFLGFLLNAMSWTKALKQADYAITESDGMASQGLSIFAKYIPGKIWVIMGRAEYLAKTYGISRKDLGSLSFDAQFIALWSALLLGTIGMISIHSINLYGLSVLILFSLLSLVIYTPLFHRFAESILSKILKKQITFPKLSFLKVLKVTLWYVTNWGIWCLAFYFLAGSLVQETLPLSISFAFGLAGSIGILAIFAPGGLGVREGIITGYLTIVGLNLTDATTIAVTSRLWFLVGELFIFFIALILDRRKKQSD